MDIGQILENHLKEQKEVLTRNAEDQQKLIEWALHGDSGKVKEGLEKYSDISEYPRLHDNIARIAIMRNDKDLFKVTDHHPRLLLKEFAKNFESIKFMVDIYRETGFWDSFYVHDYIWESASVESAKYMMDEDHYPPDPEEEEDY